MRNNRVALFILIFCSFFVVMGCGRDKKTIETDFSALISGDIKSEDLRAAAEFLDENIPLVKKDKSTEMVVAYENYLNRYINEDDDDADLQSLSVYFDFKNGHIDQEKIESSELKEYYDDIKFACLMIVSYEEAMELKIDYAKLLDKYGDNISDPLYKLYEFNSDIALNPMTENASLLIKWEEILDRAHRVEGLLKEYPDEEIIKEDANWLFKTHLNAIFMGTTNTPIFNYKTHEFSKEAQKAYITFVNNYPDSTITWAIKEYFSYLASIDYSLDFNDSTMSKIFFDTCDWLVSEAEKRVSE